MMTYLKKFYKFEMNEISVLWKIQLTARLLHSDKLINVGRPSLNSEPKSTAVSCHLSH